MPLSTPPENLPPEFRELVITFLLSMVSGVISIARRIVSGHESSWLWVISEFLTAILCGYLMYSAYPALAPFMPSAVTLPVAVALAAHSGGRIFQELEGSLINYIDRRLKK